MKQISESVDVLSIYMYTDENPYFELCIFLVSNKFHYFYSMATKNDDVV